MSTKPNKLFPKTSSQASEENENHSITREAPVEVDAKSQQDWIPILPKTIQPPKKISYRTLEGKTLELDWETLRNRLNQNSPVQIKAWAGNYYVKDKNELNKFKILFQPFFKKLAPQFTILKKAIKEEPALLNSLRTLNPQFAQMLTSEELYKNAEKTMSQIQLVELPKPLGNTAFSLGTIKQGSLLPYGGQLSFNIVYGEYVLTLELSSFEIMDPIHTDAEEYRDFSGWLADCVHDDIHHKILTVINNEKEPQKAGFILEPIALIDLNIIVPVLKAVRDIGPNEILTFPYGIKYFVALNKLKMQKNQDLIKRVITDKYGNIIPSENFQIKSVPVYMYHPKVGENRMIVRNVNLEQLKQEWEKENRELNSVCGFNNELNILCYLSRSSFEKALQKSPEGFYVEADGILTIEDVKNLSKPLLEKFFAIKTIFPNLESTKKILNHRLGPWKIPEEISEFPLTLRQPIPKEKFEALKTELNQTEFGPFVSFGKDEANNRIFCRISASECYLLAKKLGIIKEEANIIPNEAPRPPIKPLHPAFDMKARNEVSDKGDSKKNTVPNSPGEEPVAESSLVTTVTQLKKKKKKKKK